MFRSTHPQDFAWVETSAEQPPAALQTLEVYFAKHPIIAGINLAAVKLLDILGPMFWAALIILIAWAEMRPH